MALYEYKCKDCGKVSEILVLADDFIPECRFCGSKNLEKLLSTFAVSMAPSSSPGPMPSCPSGGCCGGSCGLN